MTFLMASYDVLYDVSRTHIDRKVDPMDEIYLLFHCLVNRVLWSLAVFLDDLDAADAFLVAAAVADSHYISKRIATLMPFQNITISKQREREKLEKPQI